MHGFRSALLASILVLGLAHGGALASGGPTPTGHSTLTRSPVPVEVQRSRYGSPRALYPLTHPRPGKVGRLFLDLKERVRRWSIHRSAKRAHLAPSAQRTLNATLDTMGRDWPVQGRSVERYKFRWGGRRFAIFDVSELRPDGTQKSTTSIISVTPNLTVMDHFSGTRSQGRYGSDADAAKGKPASPLIAIEHRGGREVRYTVTPTKNSADYDHALANTRYYLQQEHKSVPDALRAAGLAVTPTAQGW